MNWNALIRYYQECLRREGGFDDLIPRSPTGERYIFSKGRTERLFSNPAAGLIVTDAIRSLAASAVLRGETVYYGYPVFVHQGKVGSLLAIELALPAAGEPIPDRLVPRSDEPFVHPSVLAALGMKDEQLAQFLKEFVLEPVLGSAEALRTGVSRLTARLEIREHQAIDPEALHIVAEGAIDSDGLHNMAMLFRGTNSEYNRRLLEELDLLQNKGTEAQGTAAGLLLDDGSRRWTSRNDCELLAPIAANDAQWQALQSSLTDRLTVVSGPPGTGKSQLVTNIVASAWASGLTVLVVSTNNRAVDVACKRLKDVHPGLIIRTGSKEYREKARETLLALKHENQVRGDLQAMKIALRALGEARVQLRKQLDERTKLEIRLAEVLLGQESLQRVMEWPTSEQLTVMRTTRSAPRMAEAVARVHRARILKRWRMMRLSRKLGMDLAASGHMVDRFLELEVERDRTIARLSSLPDAPKIAQELRKINSDTQRVSVEHLQGLVTNSAARAHSAIGAFVVARSLPGSNRLADSFLPILEHLRGWACTALSAGATLPLRAGLFDLLIVDEASQCSIPQIIPLLFRAKQAIVIGDAQQLTHITRLTTGDEEKLAQAAGLNGQELRDRHLLFSRDSLFDSMRARVAHTHLLDEHYRCHPQIIEFSNREFYGRQLSVLTDPERLIECGPNAVVWKDVVGEAVRAQSGSAINTIEARTVAEIAHELLARYPNKTLGVVTPFAAQASAIQRELEARVSVESRISAALVAGTAHAFQGDERDILLFSPVVTPDLSSSALRWLMGTPNLFNVTITRARSSLMVVGHLHFCLGLDGPLGQLARYSQELLAEQNVAAEGSAGRVHSEAEARLLHALLSKGINVQSKRIVRGYECDFVVEGQRSIVNIECDGRHHINEAGKLRLRDQARDELIRHQGWNVVRIPSWRCLEAPEEVAAEIAAMM